MLTILQVLFISKGNILSMSTKQKWPQLSGHLSMIKIN